MPIDEFIINIYLMVEQYYKIVVTKPLRGAGYAPKLSDPDITDNIHGLLGADKGYISPSLTSYYDAQGVGLQTPLRANMKEDRPKPVVRRLMKARRIVETVIGQLSERFNIQRV